jgi:hypothetical protein
VRYYFALAIAVWSVKFLLRREYVPFVLSILLAATFHKSVLVVLVLYPLALIPWKKWQLACIAALLSTFLLFPAGWMQLIVALYPSYRDTDYLAGGSVSRINILRCAAVIILALLCAQPAEKGTFPPHFRSLCTVCGGSAPAVLLQLLPGRARLLCVLLLYPVRVADRVLSEFYADLPHSRAAVRNAGRHGAGEETQKNSYGLDSCGCCAVFCGIPFQNVG